MDEKSIGEYNPEDLRKERGVRFFRNSSVFPAAERRGRTSGLQGARTNAPNCEMPNIPPTGSQEICYQCRTVHEAGIDEPCPACGFKHGRDDKDETLLLEKKALREKRLKPKK